MAEACGNCGAALKTGMLSSNQALGSLHLRILNLASDAPVLHACNKCGDERVIAAKNALNQEMAGLQQKLKALLPLIPVVSLQCPQGWKYEPITVITAQTVTGTGIFSDVASAFTDLFGTQSGTYNAKLRDGENLCKASLRGQAIELGANAVLAVDVDYAEVGGQRAMLMVCMTGTAVRLTEMIPENPAFFEAIDDGKIVADRVRDIQSALQAVY